MMKDFFWRLVICVVPVAAAFAVTGLAWSNYVSEAERGLRFNLGVDLAGGTILVYEVDRDWWEREGSRQEFDSDKLAEVLKRRIDPNNLMEVTIRAVKTTPPRVEIILPMRAARGGVQSSADIERVKNLVSQAGRLEFRILADIRDTDDPNPVKEPDVKDTKEKAETYRPSSDPKNVPRPPSSRYAWVEWDPSQVKERKYGPDSPPGFHMDGTTTLFHDPQFNRHFVLTKIPPKEAAVLGDDLASAWPDAPQGRWEVHFRMKSSGAQKFYQLTEPVKHYMAIILDGKAQSAPILNDRLSDNGVITMGSESRGKLKEKVDELVLVLRSGALPATLKPTPVSELTMGPQLGKDTIDKGKTAIIWALIVVVAFMCLYYRFAGFVASVALFANLLLTVALMVLIKATFTLPGLAGLVLTLGMAVDANVLIYERIREERERGSSIALAIRNGYDLAFATIIDTHLTSIFTAIVLYAVGNDQLKGFGVSLTLGLLISLFTSLYMTRLMFDIWLAKGWLRELRMMKLISRPNIDFMRIRYYWFTITVLFSVLGLVMWAFRGVEGLNIDFTGGTAYSVEFKNEKPIAEVRQRISDEKSPYRLPDVSVDAIYRGATVGGGGETRFFTFRTTLKNAKGEHDPELVRQHVEKMFGEELVYVNVTDVKIEPRPKAELPAKHDRVLTLRFDVDRPPDQPQGLVGVTPAEVDRVLNGWLASKGELQPDNLHEPAEGIRAEGEETSKEAHGLFKQVRVNLALPPGASAEELQEHLKTALHQPVSERKENFDSQLALQTQNKALLAIFLSWGAICMYLWFRFGSWTFGLAAVLCLIHDLLFAAGLIAASHWLTEVPILGNILLLDDFKLDLPAVAALLTLIGHSVNDTIVIFDRIREIRGKNPDLTPQMINDSINQTMSRTIITACTVWFVVLVLYIVGGEGIHLFSFIMVIGVIVGTYSTIYVASPLLLILGEGKQPARVRPAAQPQPARA